MKTVITLAMMNEPDTMTRLFIRERAQAKAARRAARKAAAEAAKRKRRPA